jgi:tRNA pseudouridine55 synthase
MAQEKEYTGTITLGSVTPTYDLESKPQDNKEYSHITVQQILEATKKFTGEIMQVPPAHSAIKKDGIRMYERARKGIDVVLEPRRVIIKEFEIVSVSMPVVHFRVVCSTGTYIRSLAFDFGKELGCGGHLSSLCRTRIGSFSLDQSLTMESIEESLSQHSQNG